MGLIKNLEKFVEQNSIPSINKRLFSSFLEKGFPTTKDEEWKYTSLKKIISLDYNINANSDFKLTNSIIQKNSLGLKHKIVFCDGNLVSYPNLSGLFV